MIQAIRASVTLFVYWILNYVQSVYKTSMEVVTIKV